MTDHSVMYKGWGARVFFVPDINSNSSYDDDPFWVDLTLEPSGAVLVELSTMGARMRTYLHTIIHTRELSDGGGSVFSLLDDEIEYLKNVANMLRWLNKNS